MGAAGGTHASITGSGYIIGDSKTPATRSRTAKRLVADPR